MNAAGLPFAEPASLVPRSRERIVGGDLMFAALPCRLAALEERERGGKRKKGGGEKKDIQLDRSCILGDSTGSHL